MTAFLLISTGILLLIAVPIGMAMGTASLLTILQGGTLNALIITQKLLSGVSKFSLLAIPMFTLAGEVMTLGGVSDKLIYLANRVVGRFKGGLSMVTTLACMFFGAISGSATATAAAIGGIMVEPMEKAGYKKEYTAAVIASSGLLGLIIPPSGTMLMYAIVADVSVLEMFTGGIIWILLSSIPRARPRSLFRASWRCCPRSSSWAAFTAASSPLPKPPAYPFCTVSSLATLCLSSSISRKPMRPASRPASAPL